MQPFNWAYIGNGNIAYTTAKDILRGGHKIVSVYGRNKEKSKAFADKFGAEACDCFECAVNRPDVDGVYIATPHTAHVNYAVAAMKLGKPVLCEKPVGVSLSDVNKLIEASKETNTYFCEAMWTWFSDVALTVKKWVQSGEIGEVKDVKMSFAFPGILKDKNSRVLTPETAGGALLDIGIYPITYCYNLFGVPEKITCKGKVKNGIDLSETVTLHYNSFKCTLKMSLCRACENCVIKGTKGVIKMPFFHMASKAVLKTKGKKQVFEGKTDYLTEFTRAAEEIRSGETESRYIPFEATRECMKIMDECRRQMNLRYPFEK